LLKIYMAIKRIPIKYPRRFTNVDSEDPMGILNIFLKKGYRRATPLYVSKSPMR